MTPWHTSGKGILTNLFDSSISGLRLSQGTNLNYVPYFDELKTHCFVNGIKRQQILLFFTLLCSLCYFHMSQNRLNFNFYFGLKMFFCAITLFLNVVWVQGNHESQRGCLPKVDHLTLHCLPTNDSFIPYHQHPDYHILFSSFVKYNKPSLHWILCSKVKH